MIWFVIGLVVFVVISIIIFCDTWYDLLDKLGFSTAIFACSMGLSLIVCLVASSIISDIAEVDYNVVSDTKIVALKDNQNIHGGFYIIGGYVDEDLYYYYATETEFGYKTEKLRASNSYIKYTDDEAHIEKYEPVFAKDYVYVFAFPLQTSRHIIYCPDGTVTNEFKVDLE